MTASVKPYERKCKNWLDTFTKWCLPRSEASEHFILWTGIFTLAAAMRRHAKIPRDILGSYEVSPNVYILFVAPPGRARKSTTLNYAEDLLDGLQRITKAPTIVTQASLLNRLVTSDDSSIYVLSAEFGSFIKKSGVEMFEFLTDIFDGRKNIEASTISRGIEFAERPCVNLLGATTPKWIAENMPESVIGGGFASRVIFVYVENVRRRQLYYRELDHDALDKKKKDLISDLQHIADSIKGEYDIDEEAEMYMQEWYKANADEGEKHDKLSGYFERKPAHIHKIALLLRASYSDNMTITLPDVVNAKDLLEMLEPKLSKIFNPIGKNVHAPDMMTILAYVTEKGQATGQELKKEFFAVAAPTLLDDLLVGLVQADFLTWKDGVYKPSVPTEEPLPPPVIA